MEGFLLLALLLLGGFAGVSTRIAGELCRAWNYGVDPLVGAFQCPEGSDTTDARFCCGTCTAPYCCSLGEARLDQAQCALATSQKAEAGTKLPDPTPTSHGGGEDSPWMVVWFYIVMGTFFVFVGFGTCYFLGLCDWLRGCQRRTRQPEADPEPEQDERSHLISQARPSPSYAFMDPAFAWQVKLAEEEALEAERGPKPLQTIRSTGNSPPPLESDNSVESTV